MTTSRYSRGTTSEAAAARFWLLKTRFVSFVVINADAPLERSLNGLISERARPLRGGTAPGSSGSQGRAKQAACCAEDALHPAMQLFSPPWPS